MIYSKPDSSTEPIKEFIDSESENLSSSVVGNTISTESVRTDTAYNPDIYLTKILQYNDIIIPYNDSFDSNYLNETLFIGDSNTAGLSAFGYMPLQNVIGKKSMGIQGVVSNKFVWFQGYSQPVNIVQAVKLLKPRRIIINFGTNNTIGINTSEFKKMYKNAISSIRETYPYCDIIIAAILPVGYYRENHNIKQETIDNFNLSLAQLCLENSCWFLDYSEAFKNPETGYMNKGCAASDGVHLNNNGYKVLLEYVSCHQLSTKDRRPDTNNVPAQIQSLSDISDKQYTVNAYVSDIPEQCIDNSATSCDNTDSSSLPDDVFSSRKSCPDSDYISGSQPGLDNTDKEKPIYDPFL